MALDLTGQSNQFGISPALQQYMQQFGSGAMVSGLTGAPAAGAPSVPRPPMPAGPNVAPPVQQPVTQAPIAPGNLGLLSAGATMMQSGGSLAQALGQGIQSGVGTFLAAKNADADRKLQQQQVDAYQASLNDPTLPSILAPGDPARGKAMVEQLRGYNPDEGRKILASISFAPTKASQNATGQVIATEGPNAGKVLAPGTPSETGGYTLTGPNGEIRYDRNNQVVATAGGAAPVAAEGVWRTAISQATGGQVDDPSQLVAKYGVAGAQAITQKATDIYNRIKTESAATSVAGTASNQWTQDTNATLTKSETDATAAQGTIDRDRRALALLAQANTGVGSGLTQFFGNAFGTSDAAKTSALLANRANAVVAAMGNMHNARSQLMVRIATQAAGMNLQQQAAALQQVYQAEIDAATPALARHQQLLQSAEVPAQVRALHPMPTPAVNPDGTTIVPQGQWYQGADHAWYRKMPDGKYQKSATQPAPGQ